MPIGRFSEDLEGLVFGRLVVLSRSGFDSQKRTKWLCLCTCGKQKIVRIDALKAGTVKSCGCLVTDKNKERSTTHGQSNTKTYHCWKMMLQRCYNPVVKAYPDYGGRGIQVCDRWLKFENFFADMGEQPEGLTIDRFPDNDGSYEPGNCRWATPKQQNNNRRNTLFVYVEGHWMPMADYARSIGKRQSTVWRWYKAGVLGLPVEQGR